MKTSFVQLTFVSLETFYHHLLRSFFSNIMHSKADASAIYPRHNSLPCLNIKIPQRTFHFLQPVHPKTFPNKNLTMSEPINFKFNLPPNPAVRLPPFLAPFIGKF